MLTGGAGCSGSVYVSMFPFQMYSLILEVEDVDHHLPNMVEAERSDALQRRASLIGQLFAMTRIKMDLQNWRKCVCICVHACVCVSVSYYAEVVNVQADGTTVHLHSHYHPHPSFSPPLALSTYTPRFSPPIHSPTSLIPLPSPYYPPLPLLSPSPSDLTMSSSSR